jgi:hypothetical protein
MCSYLHSYSADPLFSQIGTQFIKTQTQIFGTDHFYNCDPFNGTITFAVIRTLTSIVRAF